MGDSKKLIVGKVGPRHDVADRCQGPDGEMNRRYHRSIEFDVVEPLQRSAVAPRWAFVGFDISWTLGQRPGACADGP